MKKDKIKYVGIWSLAIVITLTAVVFQRMTGPTHPKAVHFEINGKTYKTRLPRSLTTPITNGTEITNSDSLCTLNIKIAGLPADVQVSIYAKRFRTDDHWNNIPTIRKGDELTTILPAQPPAGKLAYYLVMEVGGQQIFIQKDEPVVIRFKNDVPAGFLIPHILFMFIAMLLSNLTGLLAWTKNDKFLRFATITLVCLGIGGLILGPIIQKLAFGVYWSGWPFGFDLTDNKTLIAFIFWLIAILVNRNKKRYVWGIVASIVMLLIYCVPHSTLGSEYDYSTGKLKTEKME